MARGFAVVGKIQCGVVERVALVTHSNLLTLMLPHFDGTVG